MTQPRLPQTEEAQYRYDDDHRSDEPNDIVHDFSPVAWKARASGGGTWADQPFPADPQQTPSDGAD